ncbi:MAG: LTA synthase family protein [Methylophaga sp.]
MTLFKTVHSIKRDLAFLLMSALMLMLLQMAGRVLLLCYNIDLADGVSWQTLLWSFVVGIRFDLVIVSYALIPISLMLLLPGGIPRRAAVVWLTMISLLIVFLAVVELDFYREFHVRLNSLATQYINEDPATVISMIWYGYPVIRYLLAITLMTVLLYLGMSRLARWQSGGADRQHYFLRCMAFILVALITVVAARGTLRQGPPLRWGDAFFSESLFANHLALNGIFSLSKAMLSQKAKAGSEQWLEMLPDAQAESEVRKLLLTRQDQLLSPEHSPVLRHKQSESKPRPLNVVLILMESFSARFIDSFGHDYGITPEFDRLRKQGLLFTNFFSNGTHTHQGMFASMACFPNLPGHEYLMQQPEGDRDFHGMLSLMSERDYQSLYVYNGDFAWDNQKGFFSRQGMQRFIGRHDFVHPRFSDPTWGVSDEDMFDRAAEELKKMPADKPFFAFLQTLSNHTPYALPKPLPVKAVQGFGHLNEHLTAMRYSDWALGRFFDAIKDSDFYDNTLFVIVGDHGFGTRQQLTEIDMLRFHVPMLILGPDVREHYGDVNDKVGSQVDIVPTIAGLLGGDSVSGCWGRNLLEIEDEGFAVIKPSGSDPTTAIIKDKLILVRTGADRETLYHYELGSEPVVKHVDNEAEQQSLLESLEAYIQLASRTLKTTR